MLGSCGPLSGLARHQSSDRLVEFDSGKIPVRRVLIVYKTLPHYRVDFFDRLRNHLRDDDVELVLAIGQPDKSSTKNDTSDLPWATHVRNRYLRVAGRQLIWQPVLRVARSSDVVIVEQASKLLVNPLLMTWRRLGGPKYCLWGHGRNRDARTASRLGEWWKLRTLRGCDWWFAYTDGTRAFVAGNGFPTDRVSVVQNAIDTDRLRRIRSTITGDEQLLLRQTLNINSNHVAVYVGSIYAGKRPEFLIEAADLVRCHLPDFTLLVIGDGPDRGVIEAAAETRPWIRVLGAMRDQELVRHACLGSVMLMPGLVGLAILDSFALELPMITAAVANHSPEIEYLDHGLNGLIVPAAESAEAYAAAVVSTLSDDGLLETLRSGCRAAAERYTVDEMVERFRQGVLSVLAEP